MPPTLRLRSHHLLALASILALLGLSLLLAVLPTSGASASEEKAAQLMAATPPSPPLTWLPSRSDGFGQTASAVHALAEYRGLLYAGLASDRPTPVLIWAFDEQTGWSTSSSAGFGGPNSAVHALAVYNDILYAGTSSPNGGQIWSSGGMGWSHVADNGFDDPANDSIQSLAVFQGRLYAATSNANGAQVWAYDGQRWTRVLSSGLVSANNIAVETLMVHNGRLYAGMRNAQGAQIWSTANGDNWDMVMGNGFGQTSNVAITALAGYHGRLYAAVENSLGHGGEVWHDEWNGWQLSARDGFAGSSNPSDSNNLAVTALAVHNELLYASTVNNVYGTQIWFNDGSGWWPSTKTGLGTGKNNRATRALASYEGGLWAGIENAIDGAAVWYGRPEIEFTVVSRYGAVAPPNRLHYKAEIINTLGITLTGLQAFDTWESSGGCVYDLHGRSHIRWDIGELGPGQSREHQFSLLTHSWCQPQVVINTVRLHGDNLAPMFAFASTVILEAPTPTASPTSSPTSSPTPILPAIVTFQQGANEYSGALDTHLTEFHPWQRNCNEPRIRVGANNGFAGLIRFDLSSIPTGANVVSATLHLYALQWTHGRDIQIGLYAISRTVDVCQANWNEARSGEPWATAGCKDVYTDRRPDPEVTFITSGLQRWYDLDVSEAVRGWVDGSLPNNGLLLLGPADDSEIHEFASGNHAQQAERPVLSVAYFSAPPTSTPTQTPSATPICPHPFEPNDTFSEAWDIGWGGHIESYICSAEDVDYYLADIGARPFNGFAITLNNLPADYDLHIYNMAEEWIASSAQSALESESVTVQGQRIYVKVSGADGASNALQPYHLDVIPVTVATATATTLPTRTATPSPTVTATVERWHVYLPIIVINDNDE